MSGYEDHEQDYRIDRAERMWARCAKCGAVIPPGWVRVRREDYRLEHEHCGRKTGLVDPAATTWDCPERE